MPFGKGNKNNPSKRRRDDTKAARDKRLNQMKKVSSSSQKKKPPPPPPSFVDDESDSDSASDIDEEEDDEQPRSKSPLITTRRKVSFKSTMKKKHKERSERVMNLLMSPTPNCPENGTLPAAKVSRAATPGVQNSDDAAQLLCGVKDYADQLLKIDTLAERRRHKTNSLIVEALQEVLDQSNGRGTLHIEQKVTKETLLAIISQAAKTADDKKVSGGATQVYEHMEITGNARTALKRKRVDYSELYGDLTGDPVKAHERISKRQKRSDAMPPEAEILCRKHHMVRCSRFESNKQGMRKCTIGGVTHDHAYRTQTAGPTDGFTDLLGWKEYDDYLKKKLIEFISYLSY